VEQEQADRAKVTAEAQGNLGHPNPSSAGRKTRDLAMFNLAIDSKLRACVLTKLRVRDVCMGTRVAPRATVMQQKTRRPVQFEITEQTRENVENWITVAGLCPSDFLFPSGFARHLIFQLVSTRGSCIIG
jgi:integrase